jgi:hypothetical protein
VFSLGVLKNNLKYFKRKSVLMVCVYVELLTVNHLHGLDLDCIREHIFGDHVVCMQVLTPYGRLLKKRAMPTSEVRASRLKTDKYPVKLVLCVAGVSCAK